jgi:hypothetical protein
MGNEDTPLPTAGGEVTYVSKAWYRDEATWFNIISAILAFLELSDVTNFVGPERQGMLALVIAALNIIVRFFFSTRPVAMQSGTPVQVRKIAMK